MELRVLICHVFRSLFFPLPEPDEQGRSVYVLRAGINDPNKYSMAEMFRVNYISTIISQSLFIFDY
jgi:hypothetical protein